MSPSVPSYRYVIPWSFWALLGLYGTSIMTYCLACMRWDVWAWGIAYLLQCYCWSTSVGRDLWLHFDLQTLLYVEVLQCILTVILCLHLPVFWVSAKYMSVVVWNYLSRFFPSLSSLPSFLPALTIPYPLLSPLTLPCPSPFTEPCPIPSSSLTLHSPYSIP